MPDFLIFFSDFFVLPHTILLKKKITIFHVVVDIRN